MKKVSILLSIMLISVSFAIGQSIKGPEQITYFQAPANGIQFAFADVFLSTDNALINAKKEDQQAKNSAMGSKFGALGTAVADAANSGMDAMTKMNKAIDALKDDKGRFAEWSFIPPYIMADAGTKTAVIVEIFVLNEDDPSPSAGMGGPLQPDAEGYYDVPYYVNCRYKVTSPKGELIAENNLGVLQGKRKTKHYKAPPAPGAIGSTTVTDDEPTTSEKIGINVAYNRVRQDVYGRFGFGQFSAPIKLGVIKEIKESKELIKPTLAIFEGKQGLLLSTAEKAEVQKFVDVIESNISNASEKTRWVAYHNLTVCYAWLENPEKAKEYYAKYAVEIKETIDKMNKWNLLLQGKLPKEERKGVFVGTSDMKKYQNYNDIEPFVLYYAAGAKRYEKLFKTINRDLSRFVDYYAHNDILCQLFELDYPFQFFPLNDFAGAPKSASGQIVKEGKDPIDFNVKFDSKRRIKEVQAEQIILLDDGAKEKLISRELEPEYDKETGAYVRITTPHAESFLNTSYGMNYVDDPLLDMTMGKAKDITKSAGFLGGKTSDETVQLKVDLEGVIYFTGRSNYFKANATFQEMLDANGIVPKRKNTVTNFVTRANINEKGILEEWSWDGSVTTSFGTSMNPSNQEIVADKMLRSIKALESDEHGNPLKIDYNFAMQGKLNVTQKMSVKEWFVKSYEQGSAPRADVSSDGFSFEGKAIWNCTFKYDEQGNWTEMKMGPYTATRTFKY